QAARYIHTSNYFIQEPQLQLAEAMTKASGYTKVFFGNSGTEVIEGAIKLARKWGSLRGKTELVAFSQAFHGRTMGALSLMDRPNHRNGFGPFLENCHNIEFNNVATLQATVSDRTAAVVLEFIQGEGGVRPASLEFVRMLKDLQAKHGFLVIADEIQSGLGRTGKLFGFQHYDIAPDVVVVAKPLGGGLPLGAILGGPRVVDVFEPGNHGTTFGGNPVACAAGNVVLQEIINGGLMQNASRMGEKLQSELQSIQKEYPALVREVRGMGLMVGMELTIPYDGVVGSMRDLGVLVNGTAERVLRFVPPLIIGEEHIQEACVTLRQVLSAIEVPQIAALR
ncbi:MAG: aspartate aminotransferase family protein, partial [Bacteroidota bacterium]